MSERKTDQIIVKLDWGRLLESSSPMILDLGCGQNKRQGSVGIDRLNLPNVDIVGDVTEVLKIFPAGSVDVMYSSSLLEHLDDLEGFIRESIRVLSKNGEHRLFVPHFSNPYFYSDYTHFRFFGLYTFDYFANADNQLSRKVPNFYTDVRILITRRRLIFNSPFWIRGKIKRAIGRIFNVNSFMQELYEENLTWLIPCYGLEVHYKRES